MNFSVCLIARNEEKTLPRLLASLEEFRQRGGEIILVDTGSTDKTVEVARSLGAAVTAVGDRFRIHITEEIAEAVNKMFLVNEEGDKVILKAGESLFDYSSARNFAAYLASNDMIAMPDCDEAYTKLDLDKVQEAINSGVEQIQYNFVFSHDEFGNPVIEFMHSKFYDRRKLKWTGIIHEVLTGQARSQFFGPKIIKLEHWQNHETNRSGYLRGLALDCFRNPANDRNCHYLGRELVWSGRPRSAIKELERHIKMNAWQPERSQSAIYIGEAYLALGDEEQAVEWWERAYNIESKRREPLVRLAEHYWRKGDPQRVAAYANASLTILQDGFYANNAAHYRQVPHELLYWALWQLGDIEGSREHWKKALEFMPLSPKYLHDQRFYENLPVISILLPTLGRPDGLEKAKKSIENLIYPKELIELIVEDGTDSVPTKIDRMYKQCRGEYIVFASNDVEFTPESLMVALNYSRKFKKGLVSFNTGTLIPDKGNICEHFLISRDLVERIGGEIFCTRMNHLGVDNLLWAKCDKLNEAGRCEDAVVLHKHFSTGKSEFDWVYKKAYSLKDQDHAILKEELAKLEVSYG